MTMIPNRVEWAVLMYTSFMMGLNLAPLDFRTLAPPRREELKHLLALLGPTVVVVSDVNGAVAISACVHCRLDVASQQCLVLALRML